MDKPIQDISELPKGQPLETPLHPKRRRKQMLTPKETPQVSPSSSIVPSRAKLAKLMDAMEKPLHPKKMRILSPKRSPKVKVSPSPKVKVSPSPQVMVSPSPKDKVSPSPQVKVSPSPKDKVSPSPQVMVSPSPKDKVSPSPSIVPSPANLTEREDAASVPPSAPGVLEGSPPSTTLQHSPSPRRLRDGDTSNLMNYGSEEDSSEDEEIDDLETHTCIPRAFRHMMDTPLDQDVRDAEEPTPIAGSDVASTETYQPLSLFDFEWKPFPYPPIPPESRRETFSQINVGPTTPRHDPYDIFIDIWDRPVMEHIVSETNKYAQQLAAHMMETNNLHPKSRISRWVDTTVDELYVLFGLLLVMGTLVKSRTQDYWSLTSGVFQTPGFNAYMPIDRFTLLCRCIHFNDNNDMRAVELDHSEAKLFKIKPILSHLNKKFEEMYIPSRNIALDESLLMWKGSLDINQVIPNKIARMGIKTYEICESRTGYLWRFEVHTKKAISQQQQALDPLAASIPSTVLRLTRGLEFKGYTLWMDNYYNSPCLARHLKSIGFDVVGTLRTDRKYVPKAFHDLTKQKMLKGQIAGLTSGDLDVMVWRDNNRVAMISTYHGNAQSNLRGTPKPTLILDYNIMMGGVDKKDQLLAMYPVERKRTKVWYKKLFRRLLNISVLNSYVIYRFHSPSISHRQFRVNLINALLSKHKPLPVAWPLPPPKATPLLPPTATNSTRADITHRIAQLPFSVKQKQRLRRHCVCCRKLVNTYCFGCDKATCIDPCFVNIHS